MGRLRLVCEGFEIAVRGLRVLVPAAEYWLYIQYCRRKPREIHVVKYEFLPYLPVS
jgi:hypothetical protein